MYIRYQVIKDENISKKQKKNNKLKARRGTKVIEQLRF